MKEEPLRVMVVDDDPDVCETLADALAVSGCTTLACADAAAAQRSFAEFDPHCVMVDVRMSGMDGLDLARWIRGRAAGDVVLIAMSGVSPSDHRVAATFDLVDHWFEKPVDPAVFQRVLRVS
jgi:two-component system CheB/CheR fusion protein